MNENTEIPDELDAEDITKVRLFVVLQSVDGGRTYKPLHVCGHRMGALMCVRAYLEGDHAFPYVTGGVPLYQIWYADKPGPEGGDLIRMKSADEFHQPQPGILRRLWNIARHVYTRITYPPPYQARASRARK